MLGVDVSYVFAVSLDRVAAVRGDATRPRVAQWPMTIADARQPTRRQQQQYPQGCDWVSADVHQHRSAGQPSSCS